MLDISDHTLEGGKFDTINFILSIFSGLCGVMKRSFQKQRCQSAQVPNLLKNFLKLPQLHVMLLRKWKLQIVFTYASTSITHTFSSSLPFSFNTSLFPLLQIYFITFLYFTVFQVFINFNFTTFVFIFIILLHIHNLHTDFYNFVINTQEISTHNIRLQ